MLADSVMVVVEAMVQKTDQRSSETGSVLQQILAAGADEEGHWDLPLAPERRESMQQVPSPGCRPLRLRVQSTASCICPTGRNAAALHDCHGWPGLRQAAVSIISRVRLCSSSIPGSWAAAMLRLGHPASHCPCQASTGPLWGLALAHTRMLVVQAVLQNFYQMDETLLANAMGWMQQASDDRIDGEADQPSTLPSTLLPPCRRPV